MKDDSSKAEQPLADQAAESPRPAPEGGARRIDHVIDAMLEHVPAGHPLEARLLWLKRDASYKAPEMQVESWIQGNEILSNEFGPPVGLNQWQAEVVSIWMNQRTSELKG